MQPIPRILLIGRNGQIGWELERTLHTLGEVCAVDFPEIDLTRPDSIREWASRIKPQIILNAAAYTAVDQAEKEPELARSINTHAPALLAEWAADHHALLVHYSTEYVFDGAKASSYLESDVPSPVNAYGESKLGGDLAIQASGCRHLIFRTCWIYGARGKNFLRTILQLAREGRDLRIVQDQVGSPTWSRMIAQATSQVLAQGMARGDEDLSGLYNLSAEGQASWHEFAVTFLEKILGGDYDLRKLSPIPTSEFPTPARRPGNSLLSKDKIRNTFDIRVPDWKESLELVCMEIR